MKVNKIYDHYLETMSPSIHRLLYIGAIVLSFSCLNAFITEGLKSINFIGNLFSALLLIFLYIRHEKIGVKLKLILIALNFSLFALILLFITNQVIPGVLLLVLSGLIIQLTMRSPYPTIFGFINTSTLFLWGLISVDNSSIALSHLLYIFATYFGILISVSFFSNELLEFLLSRLINLEESNEAIKSLTYYDQLTHLMTRNRFAELFDEQMSENAEGTLYFFDIAEFKRVNNFYGLSKGDQILIEIGNYLSSNTEPNGLTGYLGANTFVVWSKQYNTEGNMQTTFERLTHEINLRFNSTLQLDVRLIAYPMKTFEGMVFDKLYTITDVMSSKMKKSGELFLYFDAKQYETYKRVEKEKDQIIQAVYSKKYNVFYQEKYNSQTHQVIGLEALARFNLNGEYLRPDYFIEVLESEGHIVEFGMYMIECVFQEFSRIVEKYGDIVISINLSPNQLMDQRFLEKVQALLDKYNIKPYSIEFEITENIFISNIKEIIELIHAIRALHIRIALDDFGIGYSSLNYLAKLPIDVIKIDKMFVDQMMHDHKIEAVLKAIISISEELDLEVVAEGVEDSVQVAFLHKLKCDTIQGYVFSRPQPLKVLLEK